MALQFRAQVFPFPASRERRDQVLPDTREGRPPLRQPRSDARPARLARGPARHHQGGDPAGAAPPVQGVLRGDVGRARRRLPVLPAGRGRLRFRLRSPARHRSRREAEALPQAEGRGHLPAAAPGGRRPELGLLHGGRIRHPACHRRPSGPQLPRTRPLLRTEALSEQAHGRAALARHLDLRPPFPGRRDARLREPRRHGSAPPRPAFELPPPPCPGSRAMARQGPQGALHRHGRPREGGGGHEGRAPGAAAARQGLSPSARPSGTGP